MRSPADLRPAVLRALSQQATFRLVLLTRRAEMAAAAAQALLQGAAAVELQDIDAGAAADYLTRTQLDPPPQRWHELTSRLRQQPVSPLAQALNNPLTLTLVRDTYRPGDDAGELLGLRDAAGAPASREDIVGYLLDRVLPAAYIQQPGKPPPRYDLRTAERALGHIATRMNEDGTRDLQWWHVPAWAHTAPRFIATFLVAGLMVGLGAWLVIGVGLGAGIGIGIGVGAGLVAGLGAGLLFGFAFGPGNKSPKRIASVRLQQLLRREALTAGLKAGLEWGVMVGVVAGVVAGLGIGVWAGLGDGFDAGFGTGYGALLVVGPLAGLGAGLAAGLVAAISRPGTDNTSPLTPLASWRSDRTFGLVAGLVAGVVAGLVTGLVTGLWAWLGAGVVSALAAVAGLDDLCQGVGCGHETRVSMIIV